MHAKGHSGSEGSDCAHERVQCGKDEGPYRRFRKGGGEGPERFGPVEKDGEELGGTVAAGGNNSSVGGAADEGAGGSPSGRAVKERMSRHRRRRRRRKRWRTRGRHSVEKMLMPIWPSSRQKSNA